MSPALLAAFATGWGLSRFGLGAGDPDFVERPHHAAVPAARSIECLVPSYQGHWADFLDLDRTQHHPESGALLRSAKSV